MPDDGGSIVLQLMEHPDQKGLFAVFLRQADDVIVIEVPSERAGMKFVSGMKTLMVECAEFDVGAWIERPGLRASDA